jgi:hypothetical protein
MHILRLLPRLSKCTYHYHQIACNNRCIENSIQFICHNRYATFEAIPMANTWLVRLLGKSDANTLAIAMALIGHGFWLASRSLFLSWYAATLLDLTVNIYLAGMWGFCPVKIVELKESFRHCRIPAPDVIASCLSFDYLNILRKKGWGWLVVIVPVCVPRIPDLQIGYLFYGNSIQKVLNHNMSITYVLTS